jgi:hypothetical protein
VLNKILNKWSKWWNMILIWFEFILKQINIEIWHESEWLDNGYMPKQIFAEMWPSFYIEKIDYLIMN